MSVKLRKRENGDGTTSLILDIYKNGKRTYEFLKHLQLPAGNGVMDRQKRKENLELAKKIEIARAQELEASDYNVATETSKKVLVLEWLKAYAKEYKKKDIRVIDGVIKRFETFLTEKKKTGLLMKDFNESIALQFRDKLKSTCKGEGARSYYSRFRKLAKQAYRDKLLANNPCEFLTPPKGDAKVKDILTTEELQLLAKVETEAPEVKQAFLFCSVTGLRWIDCKNLKWESINITERKMKVAQSKTGKDVVVSLNSNAIALLGQEKGKKEYVFALPTANGANKSLSAMVKRAKIDKTPTWHSARHGFATRLVYSGADIYTTSILLGHSSLTHTRKYLRASSEMNQKAVDGLPSIEL